MIVWGVCSFIVFPRSWKKIYTQHKILHKPFEVEVTEQSFNTYSEYGTGVIPWADFHKWRENEKVLLLYQANNLMNIIPKRIFTAEEEQTLRTHLALTLGPAK